MYSRRAIVYTMGLPKSQVLFYTKPKPIPNQHTPSNHRLYHYPFH